MTSKPRNPVVELVRGAITWSSGFAVDADGSPHAYHPQSELGLDALGCAGHQGNWWGIACNPGGIPYVQGPADPAPGFYVSTTALADRTYPAHDQRRYVDAEQVPFVVMAPELRGRGVRLGDLAWVVHDFGGRGLQCGAVVADVGPHGHYGEGSIALARVLGISPSPRHGGCQAGVTWTIFPGSSRGWPLPPDELQSRARALYEAWVATPVAG